MKGAVCCHSVWFMKGAVCDHSVWLMGGGGGAVCGHSAGGLLSGCLVHEGGGLWSVWFMKGAR